MHATQEGAKRVVVLSNDTDVIVLHTHFWNMFHRQGLLELWIRGGLGDTTRYIPIHTMAIKIGNDLCKVLPALHNITGCDVTSKFGTKASALKAKAAEYLCDFGKDPHDPNLQKVLEKAEYYLVQVYKRGVPGLK